VMKTWIYVDIENIARENICEHDTLL